MSVWEVKPFSQGQRLDFSFKISILWFFSYDDEFSTAIIVEIDYRTIEFWLVYHFTFILCLCDNNMFISPPLYDHHDWTEQMKDAQIKDNSWSLCSSNGYAVKPIKGNALLFFHRHHNSEPDEGSLHGNCAVLGGDKWTANKWIHVLPFTGIKNSFLHDSDNIGCTDEEDMCAEWAANGECDRNRIYMLGNLDYYGSCRKSCGLCWVYFYHILFLYYLLPLKLALLVGKLPTGQSRNFQAAFSLEEWEDMGEPFRFQTNLC